MIYAFNSEPPAVKIYIYIFEYYVGVKRFLTILSKPLAGGARARGYARRTAVFLESRASRARPFSEAFADS
jgi:hypothetical protein